MGIKITYVEPASAIVSSKGPASAAASKQQIKVVVAARERGSLAHTLCECLFWAQHATYESNGYPFIYKTGPELAKELMIAPRTANSHLKALAAKGYWNLEYKPRPGGVGKVTWLEFSDLSLQLLGVAKTIDVTGKYKKFKKQTAEGGDYQHPADCNQDLQMSQTMTSIQPKQHSDKTQKGKFIPSQQETKQGKNEHLSTVKKSQETSGGIICPSYIKKSARTEHVADLFATGWFEHGLQPWDWSSQYTWSHVRDVADRLGKAGISSDEQIERFVQTLLAEWNWMRNCMLARYVDHPSNAVSPSPMALSQQIFKIWGMVKGHWHQEDNPKPKNAFSNLDDGL